MSPNIPASVVRPDREEELPVPLELSAVDPALGSSVEPLAFLVAVGPLLPVFLTDEPTLDMELDDAMNPGRRRP